MSFTLGHAVARVDGITPFGYRMGHTIQTDSEPDFLNYTRAEAAIDTDGIEPMHHEPSTDMTSRITLRSMLIKDTKTRHLSKTHSCLRHQLFLGSRLV